MRGWKERKLACQAVEEGWGVNSLAPLAVQLTSCVQFSQDVFPDADLDMEMPEILNGRLTHVDIRNELWKLWSSSSDVWDALSHRLKEGKKYWCMTARRNVPVLSLFSFVMHWEIHFALRVEYSGGMEWTVWRAVDQGGEADVVFNCDEFCGY